VLVGGVLAGGDGAGCGELVLESLKCFETAGGEDAPGRDSGCVAAGC
jgi:hypothetical protein